MGELNHEPRLKVNAFKKGPGECWQRKANGSVRKETIAVSGTMKRLELRPNADHECRGPQENMSWSNLFEFENAIRTSPLLRIRRSDGQNRRMETLV